MDIRYFYETDLSKLKGWNILLDYEGTLVAPPDQSISSETEKALLSLKTNNKVFICSNVEPVNEFIAKYEIEWLKLSTQKPSPSSVQELLGGVTGRFVVIGDSWARDGLLAEALGVAYIQVATLGKPKNEKLVVKGLPPAIISDSKNEQVSIVTTPPTHFYKHILFEIKERLMFKKISLLTDGLTKLGFSVQIDPPRHQETGTLFVPKGKEALNYALGRKSRGLANRVIAGPLFDTKDQEILNLLQNPEIDTILLCDELEKARLVKVNQFFEKADPWFFGVLDEGVRRTAYGLKNECRVIAKDVDEKDFKKIIEVLWRKEVSISGNQLNKGHEWIGFFGRKPKATYALVFDPKVTQEELMELWMSDIPTIVFATEEKTNLVSENCGITFSTVEEFEAKLSIFIQKLPSFSPREFAKIEGSVESMTRKLAEIIREE